jgi:cyanophycinase
MKLRLLLSALLALSFVVVGAAAQSRGPSKGTLVLTGGDFGRGVVERFVTLAGGPDANIVYIPSASTGMKLPSGFSYEPPDSDAPDARTREFERELAKLFGVRRVTVIHTKSRRTADSAEFVAPLKQAQAVWLGPGNAGRYVSFFGGTRTERELAAVLRRGGVIGGNSAGAIIQGSFIVRGRPDKPVLMARGHERGFGYLRNVAVNPHLTEARREGELVNVLDAHPELLGVGIDEKAAVVVRGDQFEVIGEGRVAVYDDRRHDANWYYWLTPGDAFDLRRRTKLQAPKPATTP